MPMQYAALTACYSMGAGNKGPEIETDKRTSYHQDKGRAVYTAIPSAFCTGRVVHSLIASKRGGSYVNTWVH